MIRRPSLRFVVASATAVCPVALPARAQTSLEYNVKAALLLNFARFIEWPDGPFAGASSPIHVCVLAPSPFGDALDRTLQAETVGSRQLSSREVRTPSDGAGCHLLFVPAGTEPRAAALLHQRGSYAVTVGESRRFEDMEGAVNLVLEGGRVRFTVNMRPVEERGIRISAAACCNLPAASSALRRRNSRTRSARVMFEPLP
jgi:YfiR/HmsC-like